MKTNDVVEFVEPEDMLRNSFHQFQNDKNLPKLKEDLAEVETENKGIKIESEDEVEEYYNLSTQLTRYKDAARSIINQPIHCMGYLKPGRLVKVKDGETEWGWGVIVNFQKRDEKDKPPKPETELLFMVDVLLNCSPTSADIPIPPRSGETAIPIVVPVLLKLLDGISVAKIKLPKDLRKEADRRSVMQTIQQVRQSMPKEVIPLLDPVKDMEITDPKFVKLLKQIVVLEDKITQNKYFKRDAVPELTDKLTNFRQKQINLEKIKELKKQIKSADNVILADELAAMKRVLRRLEFTTKDDIIQTKGRMACEINAADELVITELMFNGFFNTMTPQICAAVMSCFIFEEKSENAPKLREELDGPLRTIQECARRIAVVSQECKLTLEPEEYANKFKPTLMEVVFSWANGAKFSEVCDLTDIYEGSIVRAIRRIEELFRELVSAAKSIGNAELENKFSEAILCIKKDIAFAASLYLPTD